MTAVVAIVGRPNVGKSTLFNRLTGTRDALVADVPGVTRDPVVGRVARPAATFLLIDTGGLEGDAPFAEQVGERSIKAAAESDVVIMLGEAGGLTGSDERIARRLRSLGAPLLVAVNKAEGRAAEAVLSEWYALGLGEPLAISARRGSGIDALLAAVAARLPGATQDNAPPAEGIAISIVGRPNVGKSTLVNRILGEERMLASDLPGTTRDSVSSAFQRNGQAYRLIDTAGVRRRARRRDELEELSVVKSLRSMDEADVVVVVVDGQEGLTEQDLTLIGLAADSGRALLIAVNKWDGLEPAQRRRVRADCTRRLRFVAYAPLLFISALHGTAVGDLLEQARRSKRSTDIEPSAAALTGLLEQAVDAHPPPVVRGRRIKLRYAHLGGKRPLQIIIHGNQVASLPGAYRRYLANFFRERLGLIGAPLHIGLKQSENPYQGRRNRLNPRQRAKRRRLLRHAKRK